MRDASLEELARRMIGVQGRRVAPAVRLSAFGRPRPDALTQRTLADLITIAHRKDKE